MPTGFARSGAARCLMMIREHPISKPRITFISKQLSERCQQRWPTSVLEAICTARHDQAFRSCRWSIIRPGGKARSISSASDHRAKKLQGWRAVFKIQAGGRPRISTAWPTGRAQRSWNSARTARSRLMSFRRFASTAAPIPQEGRFCID